MILAEDIPLRGPCRAPVAPPTATDPDRTRINRRVFQRLTGISTVVFV